MSLLSPPLDEEEHDGMSSSFSEMEEDEEFVHLDSDDSEKDCMIATVAGDDRRRSTLTIPSSLSLTLTLSSSMMALSRLIVVFAAMISSSQPTPRQKEGRERGMESVEMLVLPVRRCGPVDERCITVRQPSFSKKLFVNALFFNERA